MHEINLIDRSFNPDAAENLSISVQIGNNGLAYCIYDNIGKAYCMFRKHRFENVVLAGDLIRSMESTFEKDETLGLPFHDVRILTYTRQSTLIPAEFYNPAETEKYLSFNHGSDIDHSVFSNKIEPAGIFNVFALPAELVSLIMMHFAQSAFMNQTTPFIWRITGTTGSSTGKEVHVGLNPDFFDIACMDAGKLLLYNTFQYTGENDLLYYIVFVYQKMGFDMQKVPLTVSGELGSKLSYRDIINQYIAETRYDETKSIPSLTPGLKALVPAKFLNLLNVQLCASSVENTAAGK